MFTLDRRSSWNPVLMTAAFALAFGVGTPASAQQETASPLSGTWEATGSMGIVRYDHTATRLLDGRVLVVGVSADTSRSAEIYDPVLRTWSPTGAMGTIGVGATATLLPDGRVLVSGGHRYWISSAENSAEIYDPTRGTWSLTASMSTPRYGHTATLLRDGRVLVAGGYVAGHPYGGPATATAEIYDPTPGTWSTAGALSQARAIHTATLLSDGQVLVTGGAYLEIFDQEWVESPLSTADIYDPARGTWSLTTMNTPRYRHTATLLPDGRVLVAGGFTGYDFDGIGGPTGDTATAEVYDPVAGTFSLTGSMRTVRQGHISVVLPDNRVLAAGGYNGGYYSAGADIYDVALGTWSSTSYMSTARAWHTATVLSDGTVLVVGGQYAMWYHNTFPFLASAEIYDHDATPTPDASAPQVSCGTADGAWHNHDVWITCAASDPESGLANESDSAFMLVTNVPVGTETDNAATNGRQLCNLQGGCTAAGPIDGHRVDKKPPTITIASPASGATYEQYALVQASYTCAATGAGVRDCGGQNGAGVYLADGSLIDTSLPGDKMFVATSFDYAGNQTSLSATYKVVAAGTGTLIPTDLAIALSAPAKVSTGGTMTYAMTVTNSGNSGASWVAVSNTLPPGTVFASAAASQGIVTAPSVGNNWTFSANLGTVAPGATATVDVVVTVTARPGTALTDTATVTAITPDANIRNNSATRKTNVRN